MKRPREDEKARQDQQAPPPPRSAFSFSFFDASGDDAASQSGARGAAVSGREAVLVSSSAGDRVRVLWEESSHKALLVVRDQTQDTAPFMVQPSELAPCPSPDHDTDQEANAPLLRGRMDDPQILHMDTTFEPPTPDSSSPWTPVPPPFEASLASLVWPVKPADFLDSIYGRRALAVHGTGERLLELRAHLDGFDVDRMLEGASKIVVWMKALQTGRMQYLDANADVARSCYRAGHSLYFNPSLQLQQDLLGRLTRDLGMGFAATLDGGMGGDIEIFAVKGRHVTPWHFDGQENFTIQLRGCKRWTILPSQVPDPLTNYHPASSNTASRLANRVLHRSYSPAELPPADFKGAKTVVLRPGSFFYVPAGVWHRVESLGDHDEGSLSINFSIDGARWGDVLLRCLQPLLWSDGRARERVRLGSADQARQTLRDLMGSLQEALNAMGQSTALVPDAVLAQQPPSTVIIDGDGACVQDDEEEDDDDEEDDEDEEGGRRAGGGEKDGHVDDYGARRAAHWQAAQAGYGGDSSGKSRAGSCALSRSPLSVLVLHEEDEVAAQEGEAGHRRRRRRKRRRGGGRAVATVHWGYERDKASGEVVTVDQLVTACDSDEGGRAETRDLVECLVGVLIYQGYLLQQS